MIKSRKPGLLLAGVVAACTLAWAAGEQGQQRWRDVLDTPAVKSPYAARSLLNGLARAGQRIVAVGQRGHVLWSDDGGRAWQQAEVPISSDLVAVSFGDAKNGWAVGHDGAVLHSADAGQTWTRQLDGRALNDLMVQYTAKLAADPALAGDAARGAQLADDVKRFATQGAENSLLDVWFKDASNGYAVGAFGLILRTADGGKRWEPLLHAVDNPKGLHLYAIRGVGSEVYMVGEQGLVLKLDPAAGRFRALTIPYQGTLFGIVGNERAVVVHGLRGSALRSADGGKTWQTVNTGLQVGLTASTAVDDGSLVIVSQAGHVLASRDDGATFAATPVAQPVPAAAVAVAGNRSFVIAGPRGANALTLP